MGFLVYTFSRMTWLSDAGRRPKASYWHALYPVLKPWPTLLHPHCFSPSMLPSAPTASGSARPLPGDVLQWPGFHAAAAAHYLRVLSVRPLSPLGRLQPHARPLLAEVPMSGRCAS